MYDYSNYGRQIAQPVYPQQRPVYGGAPVYAPLAQPQQTPQYLRCRPVSSIDEVKAAQIELDGSLSVFPDIGNKYIYTKQLNPDGTASIKAYTLAETPEATDPGYVTKSELSQILSEFKADLIKPAAEPAKQIKFNL